MINRLRQMFCRHDGFKTRFYPDGRWCYIDNLNILCVTIHPDEVQHEKYYNYYDLYCNECGNFLERIYIK